MYSKATGIHLQMYMKAWRDLLYDGHYLNIPEIKNFFLLNFSNFDFWGKT